MAFIAFALLCRTAALQSTGNELTETTETIGRTVKGRNIQVIKFGRPGWPVLLWTAAQHGSETNTVALTQWIIRTLRKTPERLPFGVQLWIVPTWNIDGYNRKYRFNARGVDLNRNFDTSDWRARTYFMNRSYRYAGGRKPLSEPETQALADLVNANADRIRVVMNIHCCANLVLGHKSSERAMVLQEHFRRYVAMDTLEKTWSEEAYPVTGSFHKWLWEKHQIPNILIELDRRRVPQKNILHGLLAILSEVAAEDTQDYIVDDYELQPDDGLILE